MRRPRTLVSATILAVLAGAMSVAGASAQAVSASSPSVTVVASHLNNPRGLAMAGDQLYVAEAGRGSNVNCQTDPSGGTNCAGPTGSIGVLTRHGVTRLVKGLFSVSGPGGIAAAGPVAVSADHGSVYALFAGNTVGIPPTGFPSWLTALARQQFGQFGVVQGSVFDPLSPVGDNDFRWTARHQNLVPTQFPDSNPNGLLVSDGARFVADAGANTLVSVDGNGNSHVLAFFRTPKGSITDAVPTCVAGGPDGALYVGELLGGTYAPGGARVWRVTHTHGTVTATVWARGFTTIQGCGFDAAGNFYATEFQMTGLNEDPTASPLGAVVKISPNGHRSVLGVGQLFWPSGFAAGPDGSVYVSNCSIAPGSGFGPCPNGGEIVRLA